MIKNLTPEHMRCYAAECPSLHQLEDGRLLVVGTQVEPPVATINDFANPEPFLEIAGKVGPGEAAVIISPALLDVYVAEKVREERERCALIAERHLEDMIGNRKPEMAMLAGIIRALPPVSEG
jgi:hypothetical protein